MIPNSVKKVVLELDPGASFNGSIINTCLDYSTLQDIFESSGSTEEELKQDKREDKIGNILDL